MQVGSLVVVKSLAEIRGYATNGIAKSQGYNIEWLPVDDEETVYVIRHMETRYSMFGEPLPCACLEEGVIGYIDSKIEIYLNLDFFREVQPPMSIESLVKETEVITA